MRITETALRAVLEDNQDVRLDRRKMLALTTMVAALSASSEAAQQPDDVEAVKAASNAFYSALSLFDDGSAMGKVWARTPYVTYVGPLSKSIIVWWDAQKQYWNDFNKRFSQRTASLIDDHIHVNGNLAWEIGVEAGQAQMKDGTTRKVDWIATNVYEKWAVGGSWCPTTRNPGHSSPGTFLDIPTAEDIQNSAPRPVWHRLLRRPVSEYGGLGHVDGATRGRPPRRSMRKWDRKDGF